VPCKGRSIARIEEELEGRAKKEGRVVLWTNSATRCGVVGVGIARSRGCRHVLKMPKIWQRRMLCEGRSGTKSSSLLEKREDELVWMQRRKGAERCISKRLKRHSKGEKSGTAQRGKGAAKRRMVRRTKKHSKRGG